MDFPQDSMWRGILENFGFWVGSKQGHNLLQSFEPMALSVSQKIQLAKMTESMTVSALQPIVLILVWKRWVLLVYSQLFACPNSRWICIKVHRSCCLPLHCVHENSWLIDHCQMNSSMNRFLEHLLVGFCVFIFVNLVTP